MFNFTPTSPNREQTHFLALLLGVLGLAAAGCVSAAPSPVVIDGGQESPVAAKESPETVASEEASPEGLDDVEWIFDEDRDWYYSIVQVKKIEGTYRWVNETTIRAKGGIKFEVVRHDDASFWLKAWKPTPRVVPVPKTEEELQAERAVLEAAFAVSWEEVDKLQLESADTGLPSRGQWRNNFDLADVNQDGLLDIVFGPARKGSARPNIFLASASGEWHASRDRVFPRRPLRLRRRCYW